MSELNIDNPRQTPFGPLSNNLTFPMNIDNQTWESATQYIYTNAISNVVYQNEVKKQLRDAENKFGNKDAYLVYKRALELTDESIISRALDEGMKVKLENPDVMKILMDTEPKKIEYISENAVLGVGANNSGKNLVGKTLMQIRDYYSRNVRLEQLLETYRERLYKWYVIYNLLTKEIISGNDDLHLYLPHGLQTSENLTIDHFTNIYVYGRDIQDYDAVSKVKRSKFDEEQRRKTIERSFNDKASYNFFVERFKNKDPVIYPLIEAFDTNSEGILLLLRSKYLRQFRENKEMFKRQKTFDIYFVDKIRKLFPTIPENKYQMAKKQELEKITGIQYEQLKEDLYANRKRLPAPLFEMIENEIRNQTVPSLEDIEIAEKFNLDDFILHAKDTKKPLAVEKDITEYYGDLPVGPGMQKSVKIFPSTASNLKQDLQLIEAKSPQALSPAVYTGFLNIDGFIYPTVIHFILGKLFASLPSIKTTTNAMKYLLQFVSERSEYLNLDDFGTISVVYERFRRMFEENNKQKLESLAKKALDKKFEVLTMQNLLLETEYRTLIWNSVDPVLGIGVDRRGQNFVGKYLQTLRNSIYKSQSETKLQILTSENIWDIIQNDPYLLEWTRKKVSDMVSVSRKILSYSKAKYHQLNLSLTPRFISAVLDKIYYPCNVLFKTPETEVPLFFFNIVKQNVKAKTPLISQVLWNRISSMISQLVLIQSTQNLNLFDLKTLMQQIETNLSSNKKCVPIIPNKPNESCIASALLNLVLALLKFNLISPSLETIKTAINETEILTTIDPTINKYDINVAVAIILNEKMETDIVPEIDMTDFEEHLEQSEAGEDTEVSDEEEIDYGDESEFESDLEGCGCNVNIDGAGSAISEAVVSYIRSNHMFDYTDELTGITQSYISDYDRFGTYIEDGIKRIQKSRLQNRIKINRINYFASYIEEHPVAPVTRSNEGNKNEPEKEEDIDIHALEVPEVFANKLINENYSGFSINK